MKIAEKIVILELSKNPDITYREIYDKYGIERYYFDKHKNKKRASSITKKFDDEDNKKYSV